MPEVEGDRPTREVQSYPIGYFHIHIAEVRTKQGKLHGSWPSISTSKFAFVELQRRPHCRVAGDFSLRALTAAAVSYRIHTVLTDNGTHFTDSPLRRRLDALKLIKQMLARKELPFPLPTPSSSPAPRLDIEHRADQGRAILGRTAKSRRMDPRTIKEATVKRFHYDSHDQLRQHLADFVAAYNFGSQAQDPQARSNGGRAGCAALRRTGTRSGLSSAYQSSGQKPEHLAKSWMISAHSIERTMR